MGFNPNNYKQTNADGVWADWQGGRFLIAKSGTARHTKIQEQVFSPHKHRMSLPSFTDDERKHLYSVVCAKGLLVGWDKIFDDEGNEIKYTEELAAQMLLDIPELLEFVTGFSLNHINYRAETISETAKKSVTLSSGAESGEEKTSKKS